MNIDQLKSMVVDVPNFPKDGVTFKDITPLLEDSHAFDSMIHHMCESVDIKPTKLVAIESRGFLFGAAMASKMHLGLVLARKKGKLPGETFSQEFDLEYGTDTVELHKSSLNEDDTVVIVDDVLATGGTAEAVKLLCEQAGAKVISYSFLIELGFLNGRQKLTGPIHSLIKY